MGKYTTKYNGIPSRPRSSASEHAEQNRPLEIAFPNARTVRGKVDERRHVSRGVERAVL
jgi:hypothetical protein